MMMLCYLKGLAFSVLGVFCLFACFVFVLFSCFSIHMFEKGAYLQDIRLCRPCQKGSSSAALGFVSLRQGQAMIQQGIFV